MQMQYHARLPRYRQPQMQCDAQSPHPQYRPLPVPAAARREPVNDITEDQCRAAMAAMVGIVATVGMAIVVLASVAAFGDTPEPRLLVRLVNVRGLGIDDLCESPVFELALDVDMIPVESFYKGAPAPVHAGGGNDMLRVSHRGVILAWGRVPRFTIHYKLQGRGAATVVATAAGSVLRQEMRNLIRAERQALGTADFDVDGEIPGLGGHLYCKFYLYQDDEPTEEWQHPCWVQKKSVIN